MNSKKVFYENQAKTIIKRMKKRGIEGYYCDSVESAKEKLISLLSGTIKTIGYGGSMTLDENKFKTTLDNAGHQIVYREKYKTPEEQKKCNELLVNCDAFLMSSNAITIDGELINIDGRGNRVSFLIYGPDTVYVIAGMNKIVANIEDGIRRIRNEATPPNCVRLNKNTPCAKHGVCGDCLEESICSQIVITRTSMIPGRIKVILIGEELGY